MAGSAAQRDGGAGDQGVARPDAGDKAMPNLPGCAMSGGASSLIALLLTAALMLLARRRQNLQ
jgi:hypothetical protein